MKHAKVEPKRRPPTVAVVAAGLVVVAGAVAVAVGLTSGTGPEAATPSEAPATSEAPVTTGPVDLSAVTAPLPEPIAVEDAAPDPEPTTSEPTPEEVAAYLEAFDRLAPGPATVYVLGDSIMDGARPQLASALRGWDLTVDAKTSRRIEEGVSIVQRRGGRVGRVLVVHLCTNWGGGDYRSQAERLLGSLQGVERVIWFTCTEWNGGVPSANAVIRSLPTAHPEVKVAEWAEPSRTSGYLGSDRIHPTVPGNRALAAVTAEAVGPLPAPA